MFVGHYGPAFALKRWEPRVPLVALMLAVQIVDVAWSIFIVTGIEEVRFVPGITASNALDLVYMPFTHSLVAAFAWAIAGGVVAWLVTGRVTPRIGIAVGLAVVSHWLLDLLMHRPDLPMFDTSWKVGLGLWDYKWPGAAVELATLLAGLALYATGTRARDRIGSLGLAAFTAVLVLAHVFRLVGPEPTTVPAMAGAALVSYVGFAALAAWIDRHREAA